ncbi:facilitated trehalose transporter Tret1-like [Hylaeus volcanicus]|uniref:facilitated trehalose transporter Tret1-like n=1 Tax=Hylaeus volcanicus TaxID=313075 RepID=UPI0023B7B5D4|nr:facilitated trehalose transporter Tret1-like [Hylaeus volcanicus]
MSQAANPKGSRNVTWPQWVAGTGVAILMLQPGMMSSWSSPYIPWLISPDSPIPVTMTEMSWVVSLLNLGRIFGAVAGSLCVNYLGSKTSIMFTLVAATLTWTFTVVANDVAWLYASRFFGGITLGMTFSCFSLYLGEIASSNIRGALVALGVTGITFGNFVMSIMGAYLSLKVSGTISLLLALLLLLLFIWLPESPHHYIRKKMDEKAKSSILWYHPDCDVESEYLALRKFIEDLSKQPILVTLKEFKLTHYRHSLLIILIILMLSQMSGLNNISFYLESILTRANVKTIAPSLAVIIMMGSAIIGSVLSMFLMDTCGRKFLICISSSGVALSLCLLSTAFHLIDYGVDPKVTEALAIFSGVLFFMMAFMGMFTVPPTVLGELFPPHQKCIVAFFASSSSGFFSFVATSTYLPLLEVFTDKYLYFLFAFVTFLTVPYTILFVPETKGLSLQEIQSKLVNKK